MAGHFFALYGAHLSLLQGDPLWQTWEGHHATATQNADDALQGLRFAAASCLALVDAYATARSLHPWSPAWIAWVSAWQSLALRATSGVTKVVFMVRLMRRAVLAEYVAAYIVLDNTSTQSVHHGLPAGQVASFPMFYQSDRRLQ